MSAIKQYLASLPFVAGASVLSPVALFARHLRSARLLRAWPGLVAMPVAAGLVAFPAQARFSQQDKVVGFGAAGSSEQGTSVALSADGDTAIVGGFADNGRIGAAWVFIRNGGRGAAWVFTHAGGVWTQQGGKLVGTGAVVRAGHGISVALSADGNTAIVGGPADNDGSGSTGAAWIFVRSEVGVWRQLNKLVGRGAVGAALQGASVALSADANTAIVGGPGDSGAIGAAWVFGRPGITAIHPNAGPVDGGTAVTIVGTNLFDVTGVLLGGVAATNVIAVDPTTVHATTPPHTASSVNVVVTTRTGMGNANGAYTYERDSTATTLTSSPNPSSVGQSVAFTAVVTAGGDTPSGSVMFKTGTQSLGTVDLRGGVAQLSTADLPAGAHAITAFYLRNGSFDGSRGRVRQRVR
jgi:hypothetical protein